MTGSLLYSTIMIYATAKRKSYTLVIFALDNKEFSASPQVPFRVDDLNLGILSQIVIIEAARQITSATASKYPLLLAERLGFAAGVFG
jgi:hypothetical protein